jgi:rubredoxin
MNTWQCVVCGFVYNEAEGIPEDGIASGTPWEDLPPTGSDQSVL